MLTNFLTIPCQFILLNALTCDFIAFFKQVIKITTSMFQTIHTVTPLSGSGWRLSTIEMKL